MTWESESDRDRRRADTSNKLIAMIRKLRAQVIAGEVTNEPTYGGVTVANALNAIFRINEIRDEEIACFLSVCVAEWMKRGYGGDPRLETMVVVKP